VDDDYAVTLTNCDIEDFNSTGIRLRNNGVAKISGGSIIAKASGSYTAEVYVEYGNGLVIIENVLFYQKGATRTALAPIYGENDIYVMMIGHSFTPPQYDAAGLLYTLPQLSSSHPAYAQRAININSLDVSQLYNRFAGTAVLSAGTASADWMLVRKGT
jgi:hypothetical protein